MAWYDADRNRGDNTYGMIEPGYEGRKQAIVGYGAHAAIMGSLAATKQVVDFGRYQATADHRQLYKDHGVGDNPLLGRPESSAHDRPKKGDKFAPKIGQSKGSPQNKVYWGNSPPSGDHYGKYNGNLSSDDDDEDDVICEDGVCYPKPKHNKDEDYEKEKHRAGNGYAPAGYPVPRSTHNPRQDPYYETSYPDNYYEKPKGNAYALPSYTAPVTTQPRTDPYHEKGNVSYAPPFPFYTTAPVETYSRKSKHCETPWSVVCTPAKKYGGEFDPNW